MNTEIKFAENKGGPVSLRELRPGDCFESNGKYYIYVSCGGNGFSALCVYNRLKQLENFYSCFLCGDLWVNPVKAVITLEC